MDSLLVKAIAHRCAACSSHFAPQHLVMAAYRHSTVRHFGDQVEIGIIGADVRNLWIHFSCDKPLITSWIMTPDLHNCIRCKKRLEDNHMIQPVFQILDAKMVNPADPTDVGISLNERVYFVHCDCGNPALNAHSSNILVGL